MPASESSFYTSVDKFELQPLHSFTTQTSPKSAETPSHTIPELPYSSSTTSLGFDAPGHRPSNSLSLTPLRPHMFEQAHSKSTGDSFLNSTLELLQALILPVVAIAYLSFCYSVHDHVVPLNTYGLYEITPQHLAAIKGGITSISILIITIALYPLTTLLQDLKSEEFFRTLSRSDHGVPLPVLNNISSPSFGQIQSIKAVFGRHCSPYFTAAIVSGFLAMATSTLAPAALNIQSVLSDGGIMAFAVGAVPAQSIWNMSSSIGPVYGSSASSHSDQAAAVLWAEMELGVQYSFSAANATDSGTAYVVPTPLQLSTSTSARWLSDIIILHPSCNWASTNISQGVNLGTNFSDASSSLNSSSLDVNLVDFGLDIAVQLNDFSMSETTYIGIMDPTMYVSNHTTHAPPTDGSSTWFFAQCTSGCPMYLSTESYVWLNYTNIPSASLVATDQTWEMAFLTCKPNAAIETREVRNDGRGILTVQPLSDGQRLTRQGNLHPVQTSALFSVAMMSITSNSGPSASISSASLGSNTQLDFLFGERETTSIPTGAGSITNITALPLANLTETYTRMLQSVAKSYTSGTLGTAYVPGRLSNPIIVFTSSLPHVIVSTLLFTVLSAVIIWSHFRSGKGQEFTLVNIAAAVHGSELPSQFSQMKNDLPEEPTSHSDDKSVQEEVVKMMGNRRIFIQKQVDGNAVLRVH